MPKKLKQWRKGKRPKAEKSRPAYSPREKSRTRRRDRVLVVCCARHIASIVPELWQAIGNMFRYMKKHRPKGAPLDVIDFMVLTEQALDNRGRVTGQNKARGLNMNKIRVFAAENYDYIFKVDSDMVPPKHGIVRLIETAEKYNAGIVTSLTPERPGKCGSDIFSQVMKWNKNAGARKKIDRGEPFDCSGNAGEGFMLITREALQKVAWPFYKSGGDFVFWGEVQALGIKYMCDPCVICAHKERDGPSKGKLIRGAEWVTSHWRRYISLNVARGDSWFRGLPYDWCQKMTSDEFFELLPSHLQEQEREPRWFTYKGLK